MDPEVVGRSLSGLGKGVVPGLIAEAKAMGIPVSVAADGDIDPAEVVQLVREICFHLFPALDTTRAPA
jgi:hypothetical protein